MKIATIILNVLLLIGLIPSILAAMTSPMIFDAGQSSHMWRVFWTAVALPVVIVVCQIISWIAFYRDNYSLAFKISLIPTVHVVVLILLMLTMNGTVARGPSSQNTEKKTG